MKFLFFIILLPVTQILVAQDPVHSTHSDDHKNEIGIANSAVYLLSEKEFAYSLHAHYIRGLKETRFGVGLGFERIFDEHRHNTIGFILNYSPIEHLDLSISPGITFRDNDPDLKPGFHLEALYEFELGKIHIGPVAEFAYSADDYHISLGLHIGFGF